MEKERKMDKNYDIFISYRRINSIEVEHIYDELKDRFNVFFDQESIHTGEMFENKILSALRSSKVLLLVLTKNACNEFMIRSKDSDWLIKEIKYAKDNNIPILPIIIYNEEDAREVNLLINKELQQCIPNDISFLPQMQFNKIRLERKARKGDINNLINEIEQGLYNKKIIDTIEPSNNLNKEKNTKRRSYNWKNIFVILLLPIILFLTWFFLFKPFDEEKIHISNNNDPYSLEYIIAGTRDINGKWNAWTKEKLTIKDNDEFLYFNLHYYPNKEKFKNARIGMDMVPNNLEASSPILVNYFFTADNTKPTHSYYQIESLDTIELTPVSLSWQEKKCQSRTCESNLLGYNSEQEKLNDLFTRGINLGDIDANKYGNLVIKFHIRHKKQPKSLTTNQSPLNLPTLSATNKRESSKRWLQSIHIDSSEILGLELHYYTGYVGAKNLRASIDNLNDKFFKEGEKIIVRGKVSADNLDTSYGQVTVIFDENVSLKLHRISWQKTGCKSVECETELSANYNDLFKKNGLLLGDVPKDDDSYYNGNLIVEYKIKNRRKIK